MNKKTIGHITIILSIIVIIGKFFGFFREILLANYFGTGQIVDAYMMSVTIPTILFGFLPALGVGFTPHFFRLKDTERNAFTTKVIGLSLIISLICVLLTNIFAEDIVKFIAGGFQGETFNLTVNYLRVTILLVVFNTPIQILIAYLNCKESYVFSNVTNLVLSSTQCVFVVLAAKINVNLLPYGILVSYIIQFALLALFSIKKDFVIVLGKLFDNNVISLLKSCVPIFLSNILVDINGFVDKYFASFLSLGSISALSYAFTIRSFFYYVFTTAITTIFYPKISDLISRGQKDEVRVILKRVNDWMLIIFIWITFVSVCLAEEILSIILQRGNFDVSSLSLTLYPFICYIVSLPVIAVRDLIVKVMYAFGDSRTNLIYSGSTILINILLSAILVQKLDHVGLAIATSVAAFVTLPMYVHKVKEYLEMKDNYLSIKNISKIIVSCIPMLLILKVLNSFDFLDGLDFLGKVLKCILFVSVSLISCVFTMKRIRVDGINILFGYIQNLIIDMKQENNNKEGKKRK